MGLIFPFRWFGSSRADGRRSQRSSLRLEELELRSLLSVSAAAGPLDSVTKPEIHNTLERAENLTLSGSGAHLTEVGTIGNGPDGAADVTFYHFQLVRPAVVELDLADQTDASHSTYVLSLYNSDLQDPMGNRLIAQQDGATNAGHAGATTALGAGDYFVAVSGSGNRYFNPHLAGSGYDGQTGTYQLSLTVTDAVLPNGDGPVLLRTDPADGTVLPTTPLVLRATLSDAVDPNSLQADTTVQLFYRNTGSSDLSQMEQLPIGSVNYDDSTHEVVVAPAAPLEPGYYRLLLAGDQTLHEAVIQTADNVPVPLGLSGPDAKGRDFTSAFQVIGVEGNTNSTPSADDTTLTAHELGDVTHLGLVQAAGAIGDDATDLATPFNPADVDLYHFQIVGAGNYAFAAEVFAGRIGSPLDASLQLYRLSPTDGTLQPVVGNDDSFNTTISDNGALPLFADPVLYAGLTAGDYYVGVTSQFTTYDPLQSHSGQGGFTSGAYVLNLRVDGASVPPHVVATQTTDGAVLLDVPQTLSVQFDEPVNLQQLAFEAYQQTATGQLGAVYIEAEDGTQYFPRLQSYDAATHQATFLLLAALPNGAYAWHLSGPKGLTDLGGNALVGNDQASGDYLVHFTVEAPPRGTPGEPTLWNAQEPNDTLAQPQVIGALFPLELANTVTIRRAAAPEGIPVQQDVADYYQITVLQPQTYFFGLNNIVGLPRDAVPKIWRDGVLKATYVQGLHGVTAVLDPGTYVIEIDLSGQTVSNPSYDLTIALFDALESAPGLTTGPAPALRYRLANESPPPLVSPPLGSPTTPVADPGPLVTDPGPPAPPTTDGQVRNSSLLPPTQGPIETTNILPASNEATALAASTPVNAGVGVLLTSPPRPSDPPSVSAQTNAAIIAENNGVTQTPAAMSSTNAPAGRDLVLPPSVLFALSDRALGAGKEQTTASTVYFRETTAQGQQGTALGQTTLASNQANQSVGGQAVGQDEGLPLLQISSNPFTASAGLVIEVANVPGEVLRRSFEAVRVLPAYADALVQVFETWDFGYPALKRYFSPSDTPRVVSVPAAPADLVEQPANLAEMPFVASQKIPWYHHARLGQLGILFLNLTVISLLFRNWKAKRAASQDQRRPIRLPDQFSKPFSAM